MYGLPRFVEMIGQSNASLAGFDPAPNVVNYIISYNGRLTSEMDQRTYTRKKTQVWDIWRKQISFHEEVMWKECLFSSATAVAPFNLNCRKKDFNVMRMELTRDQYFFPVIRVE